jgi:hypothetical protein
MYSSAAPTPVMPKTASAVATPLSGNWNLKPSQTAFHVKYCGMRVSTTADNSVIKVNSPTLIIAKRSIR